MGDEEELGSYLSASPEELAGIQSRKFVKYRKFLDAENFPMLAYPWDVVVLTAGDQEQADSFREQVEWRRELGVLPHGVDFHCISDPPGPRIGNGGATMVALAFLDGLYGSQRCTQLRILLIHAGGYSQRTPHHSVSGKIFAALPVGPVPSSTMLEMCLAMLCDLDPAPGVFVKCGDDIIIFDSSLVDLSREGFTALAHRSPVEVAYTHGDNQHAQKHGHPPPPRAHAPPP
jgi:hypothetical protein